jgi:PAS domain S-box-containing protein
VIQGADGDRPGRPGILGGLAQRLQEGVRVTIDVLGQSHAQRLAAIVESSEEAILSVDLDGTIATWNGGAERLLGYSSEEIIGKPVTVLVPADRVSEEAEILNRIRNGERVEHYKTVRRRRDGAPVQVSLTVSPIKEATGTIIGASKIARDITEHENALKLLADKMAEQAALYEFTDRLFRASSAEDVYKAGLDAILRALSCDRASILLFNDRDVMGFVAWRGLSDGYRAAVEGHSPWTRETRDPQPIAIADIDEADLEPSLKATVKAEGIAALAFIPLVAQGELVGKFMTYYTTPHDFSRADIDLALTIGRQLGFSLERLRAEERRRRAEEAKELLLSESKHRIKNTLGTIQAIARQTLRHTNPDEFEAFLARLRALGEAHELLTTENWDRAPLRGVVERALKPFETRQQDRIVTEGPAVWVPANTSLSLTLCLHELATNAVKYGSLSNGTGYVHVAWEVVARLEEPRLRLTWQETGGPRVNVPERKGFGSLLVQSTGEGETYVDFHPDGVRCLLDVSL